MYANTLQAEQGKDLKHSERMHSFDHPCFRAVPLHLAVPGVP